MKKSLKKHKKPRRGGRWEGRRSTAEAAPLHAVKNEIAQTVLFFGATVDTQSFWAVRAQNI